MRAQITLPGPPRTTRSSGGLVTDITGYSVYVPQGRLQRGAIAESLGSRAGKGTRSVASFDEDSTSMAVEAARPLVRGSGIEIDSVVFSTTSPAYADKTNASTIHAALQLGAPTDPSGIVARSARRAGSFSGIDAGAIGLLEDSAGMLALAMDQRSAADELGLAVGDQVTLLPTSRDEPLVAQPVRLGQPGHG